MCYKCESKKPKTETEGLEILYKRIFNPTAA